MHQENLFAMLKNELKDIEEILIEQASSDSNKIAQINVDTHFIQIYKAWEEVIFSDMPENSLVRYFHYHLEVISNIFNNLSEFPKNEKHTFFHNELLGLIDHMRKYYSSYFNENSIAPIGYHKRLVGQLSEITCLLVSNLKNGNLSHGLKSCMLKWVTDISENPGTLKYSFRLLFYFERIIREIATINYHSEDAETLLISILTRSNYNSLSFFVFRQDTIRNSSGQFHSQEEKLEYLRSQKAEISSSPDVKNLAYDPSWPSIKIMVRDWLTEEILITEKSLSIGTEVAVPKIPLEMSVAHLSCLIRLLYEESVFATQNLKFIFKCFAGHYQSKRQDIISPGSLSKEFYSIDQHTAARVRDLLQRMVLRINRNFFPMAVAINATILSYLSMR